MNFKIFKRYKIVSFEVTKLYLSFFVVLFIGVTLVNPII